MARLQILELPTEHHGDDMVTPWILVVDQVEADSPLIEDGPNVWPAFKADTGCRHVLVATETMDIPANDTSIKGETFRFGEVLERRSRDAFKEQEDEA